jgi:hypothetical protein
MLEQVRAKKPMCGEETEGGGVGEEAEAEAEAQAEAESTGRDSRG